MDGIFNVGNYLPDRPPTWSDAVVVVSGLVAVGLSLRAFPSSSLPAVAVGFGCAAILLGPVAQSRVGKRIDRWLERATDIALFAIAVFVTSIGVIVPFIFEGIPTALVRDVANGVVLFYVLVLATHMLHERRIESWHPESE